MLNKRLDLYVKKLHNATENIQEKLQKKEMEGKNIKKITGTDFEQMVYESLVEVGFDKNYIFHNDHKFPDFVLEDIESGYKVGLEVKKTDSAKWEIVGGSVYESLKNDIEDTYILMAKLGGDKPEVRLKKYEECIADLKVTHSPRFYLNMDLDEGDYYLKQNDARDLLKLSGDELNRKIRKLLRTPKSTWWSEEEPIAFSDLSREEKNMYLNDGIALFPEVFQGNYDKFTPWLIHTCFVWCGNVRDIFSSGGNRYVKECNIYVSAIMYRTLENIDAIKKRILMMTEEEQGKYWGIIVEKSEDRIASWIELVNQKLKMSKELIDNNKKLDIYKEFDNKKIQEIVKRNFIMKLKREMTKE